MLTVKSIGTIVEGNAHFHSTLTGKPIVLPHGYTMERAVWEEAATGSTGSQGEPAKKRVTTHVVFANKDGASDGHDDSSIPRFQATVELTEAGKPPLITVVRSDDPEKKCYRSSVSHTAAWREALIDAAKDFPDKPLSESKTPNGIRLMGLHLTDVVAAIRALPGGEAAYAAAEVTMGARKANSTVVDDAASSVQSTPAVTVTGSKPAGKRARSSAAKTAETMTTAPSSTSPAPKSRRSKAAPAPPKEVNVVCPDCGLAGTPFCAATGKPHEAAPCPRCGLTSAFCPVTGEAHSGAIQRTDRERGEVRLPGARRRTTKKGTAAAATAAPDGITADSAVTVEGTPVTKKTAPRRKRGAADETGEEGTAGAKKTRRTRSSKATAGGTEAAAAPADGMHQTTLPAAPAVAEPSLLDIALKEPEVFIYPTLRPPLTQTEQRRALHCMEQKWQLKGDEAVMPASAQALQIALVPAKRRAAPSTGARRPRKKAKSEAAKTEDTDANDGDDGDDANDDAHDAQTESHQTTSAADAPLMVHPLEVRDLATSASGKRLTKFLWQYMSERSKLDLLRAQSAGAAKASAPGGDAAGETPRPKGDKAAASDLAEDNATEDISTQALSDRQRSDDPTAAVAAEVLQGTSEMTLPRVDSV